MNPRLLLIIVIVLIAGAYGLGVYVMLSSKSEIDKVRADVGALSKSVERSAEDLRVELATLVDLLGKNTKNSVEAVAASSRALMMASTAAPRNMTTMDLAEFSSIHPELKAIYKTSMVGTVLPAVNSAVNRLWLVMTPAQRARVRGLAQKAATIVVSELNRRASMIPAKPSPSHTQMIDEALNDIERMINQGVRPSPGPGPRPPRPVGKPPAPRKIVVVAAPRSTQVAPVPW